MNHQKPNDLHAIVDDVRDEATFLAFLLALSEDWEEQGRKEKINPSPPYRPGANGWENGTIGAFLESAHAWGEAWLGRDDDLAPVADNPWQRAAQILHSGGKYYE